MNKLTIIGRLTKDPELRSTTSGLSVCSFTVAVDKRKKDKEQEPDADFFKVTAWRERGELCAKYLSKGNRVCVIGPVGVKTYQANDGTTRAYMEVTADEVEFLTSRSENAQAPAPQPTKVDKQTGYEQVEIDTEELPF